MKILVFCLPGIGDALMATPLIGVLRKELPNAQIDVAVMFDSVAYLFKNNDAVHSTYYLSIYDQNRVRGVFNILPLRKNNYDISLLAFPAFRREYHVVQFLAGAKRRLAHQYKKGFLKELHFLNTNLVPVQENEHNVINNLNLLHLLGIPWEEKYKKEDFYYNLTLDKKDIVFGKDYISRLGWDAKNVVGVHPGSINSLAGILKRWPVERFAEVAKYLIHKKKKIVIFFGPFEVELGEKLYNLIGDAKNCELVEHTTFSQSLGILSSIPILVTNDNGFSHIANALRVKTITLFGPTNTVWCAPYNNMCTINVRKAKFTPWFRSDMKVTSPPKGVRSGMEDIKVKDVIEKIEKIW